MRKTILAGALTVATLVLILTMQGVSLRGMMGDEDDDDAPGNLRALYHLDDFATLASPVAILTEDSSGNGNNGNLIRVAIAQDLGKFNDAVTFAGGFVEVGRDPTMEPRSVTVETWVKSSAPGTNAFLLTKGAQGTNGSYSLNRNTSVGAGNLHFDVFNGTTAVRSPEMPSARVFNGAFHHVVGTFDNGVHPPAANVQGTVKIYLDGAPIDGGTNAGTPAAPYVIKYDFATAAGSHRDLVLGGLIGTATTTTLPFAGLLDETRVWARALSANEVKVSANMGLQANPPKKIGDQDSTVYTQEWEIAGGTSLAPITVTFDMVTGATEVPATTIRFFDLSKPRNLASFSASANPALGFAGKSELITIARLDAAKDAEVSFEATLFNGQKLDGRIRIKK